MTVIRKVVPVIAQQASAENRTRVRASTNQLARDGHILEPAGLLTENFLRSGVALFDHDPKAPVARPVLCELADGGAALDIEVEWAPPGISAEADKCRGLVKSEIIRAVSIGFDPIDAEPIDPRNPRGGLHITSADLLELSFVSVPADTGAVVTQRSQRGNEDWKCGASRELPIEDSDEWDGSAAEASIFEWAGGDDFDPTKARKGFLAYNAAKPKERGSYKLPIAHVAGGRMKVPKGAIRAAASRLSQTDIPEETKTAAQAVIDHYEEKAGMADKDKGDRSVKTKHTRALERVSKVAIVKRGLYEVASLAYMLEQFGYAHACAEWEADIEGDESPVPAMMGEALVKIGEAFLAMSKEEVTELLAGKDLEIDEEAIVVEERAFVAAAKTPQIRAWRAGIAMARAGKALSATNEEKLQKAQDHQKRAMKHHKDLGEQQEEVGGHMDAITAQQSKASEAHGELGEALHDAKNEPEKATEHVARALKHHKAVAGQLAQMGEEATNMKDRHQDLGDSHQAMGRCMRSAQACVRSVVEGATPGAEDGDSKDVQTSAGDADSDGSKNDRSLDVKRRKADLAALSRVA